MRRLCLLTGGTLLFGALAAYPAYWLGGGPALIFGSAALALCLVPALGTMMLAEWSFRKSPDMFLMVVLGGTGLRMFIVLTGVWVLYQSQPYFQHMGFVICVLVSYLFTLGLEMAVLLAGRIQGAGENHRIN